MAPKVGGVGTFAVNRWMHLLHKSKFGFCPRKWSKPTGFALLWSGNFARKVGLRWRQMTFCMS
jgi:hypothetical protein